MAGRIFALCSLVFALALGISRPAAAVTVPTNFVVESVVPGATFDTPTAIAFLPGGRMLVAEKRGTVWGVVNGTKSANPVISIDNAVLNEHDRGLLGLAVDPNYATNRYIYLLYTVDPDSDGVDTNNNAYGRLVRYQMSATDSTRIDLTTRAVLMGASWPQGPVSDFPSHTIGCLRFGSDGSLLVSVGDGASYDQMDPGGLDNSCYGPGKTDPNENIGAFRSQDITSLAGKILRLNPATGQGYASNPYYDGNLGSVRSRVWAYGVRNPFRFCIRPGTGVTDPTAGNPGVAYIGDVGWNTYEEMNVVRTPGINLGWPCYEGFGGQSSYQSATPAHNGCGSFGSATNPASASSPTASWHHSNGAQSTPSGIVGNCSIGGVFYTGTSYPAQYQNQYFFADYGQNWIKVATVDANNNLVSVASFAGTVDGPVDFALEPGSRNIVYVSIGTAQVRRIRYTGSSSGNNPPTAVASANPGSGQAPLTVSFSGAGSSDPDGDPLTYTWFFGDGQGGTGASVQHTYAGAGTYPAVLQVDDGRGGLGRDTVTVVATGTVAGFPSASVRDNFNRPDGPIGGAWVGETAGLMIQSNALVQTAGAASTVWDGGVFGPNQEIFVSFTTITPTAPEHDLMLKVQGLSWSAGHIEVRYDATYPRIQISTYDPSAGWAGIGVLNGVSFQAGDQMGARTFADGTLEIYKNRVKIGTFSVAGWRFASSGGRLGMTIDQAFQTRFDDFGGGDVVMSGGNTPPQATITSPVDGSFYIAGQNVALVGVATDAQTPSDSLLYHWQVDIHHNNHIHPSSFVADGPTASLLAENHDDGTGVHYQVNLMVTDKGGLVDTAWVSIYPEIDLEPSAVTVTPASPGTGATANYAFKLYNRGRMPAPYSRWRLVAGTTTLAEADTLVPPLDSVAVSVNVPTALAPGTYSLRVVADTLGAVVETNESNNASTQPLTIAGPPGFPTAGVLDDFNRANGAIGASWSGGTSGFTISNNTLAPTASASIVWNAASFGAQQEAYLTFAAVAPRAADQGVLLKVQGLTYTAGAIEVRYEGKQSRVRVYTYSGTGWTQRGSNIPATFAPGDRLGGRAFGNGAVEVYKNATLIGTVSVTAWAPYAQGGRVGIQAAGASNARFDDFGGGNVVVSAPALAQEIGPAAPVSDAVGRLFLSSAYPNPSRAGFSFALELPSRSLVGFRVLDLQGREIWSAPEDERAAGRWTLAWPGVSAAGEPARPGIYLAQILVGTERMTRRLVVLR